MKNAFRFSAVLGAIVLALVLAGHGPASAGQAPQAAADVVAGEACTSILVGRDASTDGSIMTTHTCDCGTCDWTWRHVPAADHKPGSTRKIYHISQYKTWPPAEGLKWDIYKKDFAGLEIPEVAHTYAYHHGMFGYMNEKQVAIGESTIGCQRKLQNPTPSAKLDLTMLTLLGHGAGRDGPRGHPGHGLAGREVRLRLPRRRRDAGRRRSERGLDVRDHARRTPLDPRERQARGRLVRPARPRRRGQRLPQRIPHRRDRPREEGFLHGLAERRLAGRRDGLLRPQERQAVQLEKGLLARRGQRRRARNGPASSGCGASSTSSPRRRSSSPRRPTWTCPSPSSRTARSPSRTSWP